MRIQFCYNGDFNGHPNVIATFDVAEAPTDEQCKAIEDEIYKAMDKWEEENDGDYEEFDYWQVCHDVCEKHLKLVNNAVVKTFYL